MYGIENINPEAITNLKQFIGDYKQSISKKVIERDNWSDLKALLGELKYFELNENYRNTNSIISFCNKEYNSNMKPLGRDGNNVVVKKLEDVESLIKDAIEHNAIIITNDDIDYSKVGGLSREVVAKLEKYKPQTLGEASRISGITPAAIIAILGYLKNNK